MSTEKELDDWAMTVYNAFKETDMGTTKLASLSLSLSLCLVILCMSPPLHASEFRGLYVDAFQQPEAMESSRDGIGR